MPFLKCLGDIKTPVPYINFFGGTIPPCPPPKSLSLLLPATKWPLLIFWQVSSTYDVGLLFYTRVRDKHFARHCSRHAEASSVVCLLNVWIYFNNFLSWAWKLCESIRKMDIIMLLLAWVWIRRIKKKNRKMRRFKTRPVFRQRNVFGKKHFFHEIYAHDTEIFYKLFRMTTVQFDELLLLLHPSISKRRQTSTNSIPSWQRLAMTLRYLNKFKLYLARLLGNINACLLSSGVVLKKWWVYSLCTVLKVESERWWPPHFSIPYRTHDWGVV